MAWIESHTVLIRHRKLIDLSQRLRVPPVYAMGVLHALWHSALEQQEDGDLASWSDDLIADLACAPKIGAPQFVLNLRESKWLDGHLLHDWINYAGRYLESKYRSKQPERLVAIWAKHGVVWKERTDPGKTRDGPGSDPGQPTVPNITVPVLPKTGSKAPVEAPPMKAEKKTTEVQKIVLWFKHQMGIPEEDKAWDRAYFPRFTAPAKTILGLFGGDVEKAFDCVESVVKALEAKRLSWTPETVAKHAGDFKHGRLFK